MDIYQQPMMQIGIMSPKADNEFFENIDDIINEEDCEESVMHASVQKEPAKNNQLVQYEGI